MARKKAERPRDPDRLTRAAAGRYRTEDERFEVSQESASAWFITDAERTDDLGLARITGPYATLADVRAAIPELRAAVDRPVSLAEHRRKRAADTGGTKAASSEDSRPGGRAPRKAATRPPKPPPATWLDKLGAEEATRARRLIRAAEGAGLPDPERLVRVDLEGLAPRLAPAVLLERVWREAIAAWDADRLAAAARGARPTLPTEATGAQTLLDEIDDDDAAALARVVARETARRILEIVVSPDAPAALPRWMLDEIDERGDATGRRVGISADDLDAAAPKD